VTLADIVRVLYQRKLLIGGVFLACLLVGVGATAFSSTTYESEATMIPLEHSDIISNWLSSRHAGELVVEDMGQRLYPVLYPEKWSPQTESFEGQEPTLRESGAAVSGKVSVERNEDRFLVITVTTSDPQLSRDVAKSYMNTLEDLRPRLENITRQEAFNEYYNGDNEQEAQRRAETTAEQTDYWIILDRPLAGNAQGPNLTLNLALAGVLGTMLGVFSAFGANWLSNFRAELDEVDAPDRSSSPGSTGQASPTDGASREESPRVTFGDS